MRKIVMSNFISIDGFFAGPNREIDWHTFNDDWNGFASEQLDEFSSMILGRVTYELFKEYWPIARQDPDTTENNNAVADKVNGYEKIVFSRSYEDTSWENTIIYNDLTAELIDRIKHQPGKDIAIFGSGTIVKALAKLHLIDEYRFIIDPVILGEGRSLFNGIERTKLHLKETRELKNGLVYLVYIPL